MGIKQMNEESPPEFRIRLDDAPPKPKRKVSAQKDSQSVKKLGRRMTITTLLLFILVVVAMVAGYWDIKKRLLTVHHSGTQEAQNLSTDIQSKFSSLSLKSASLEDTLDKITNTQSMLKAALDALKNDLSKVSKLADKLSASKADKKSVKESTASLNKKLSPLSKEIQKQKDTLSSIEKSTKEDISTVKQKVFQAAKETKSFREKLDAVRAEKASKKDLIAEVDHIQEKQDKLEIGLKRVITRLESNLNQLEKEIKKFKTSSIKKVTPSSTTSPTPQSLPTSSTPPSGSSSSTQKPGKLLEQDISQ
jgi:DNA repair exonuclease SbcCD ATPase subunit